MPGRRNWGTGIDFAPDRYWPVSESGLARMPSAPRHGARVDDPATVLPRPGTHVDHVVGDLDGLLVVLDHDDRVAQVAQPFEGADQPLVVPLVQADRRLVEHVEHADQAADPIWLARRMRWASPPDRVAAERARVR